MNRVSPVHAPGDGGNEPDDLAEFRADLHRWLDDNLPTEWRHCSFGFSDEDLVAIRAQFGARLGRAGWLSIAWPQSVGGGGRSSAHQIAVLEELVACGAPEPMNTNVLGIFAPTLIRFGTAEQCQRLLPGMLDHEVIWCQGFSEPAAGSDLAGISTRATVSGDTVHITGQKVWTSNAHRAAYCYLLARTSSSQRRHDGLTMIALPMDQPGVTVRPLRNIVGTSEFCEVFLDDARAPVANIIGDVGTGWKLAMFALSQERSVGLAQRSLKLSGEFSALAELCNEERAAGNPRLTDEFYAGPLVDAYVRALTVSATVRRAVEVDAAGGDLRDLAPVAKVSWSEGHQQQLALALEVLGDRWTDEADPVARNWWQAGLFARAETIYGGTSQIQRTVLARALGLPRGA